MKILIYTVTNGECNLLPDSCKADYMSDLLFHGLRELFGANCVDIPAKMHLYKGYPTCHQLWGRGFSYTDTLDNIDVNRDETASKLANDYYDIVVVAMHNSTDLYPQIFLNTLHDIKRTGTKAKIVVLDGKDRQEILGDVFEVTPYYFKREISDASSYFDKLIPITFAIPECKIVDKIPNKTKALANIVPADHSHPNRRTHIYNTEKDYYHDYQSSYFALTCKKAGWDCMRHYEIFANGCVPIFTDIENCPKNTLSSLPKSDLSSIKNAACMNFHKKVFDKNDIDPYFQYVNVDNMNKEKYLDLVNAILKYTRQYLTTKALANYFMSKLNDSSIYTNM